MNINSSPGQHQLGPSTRSLHSCSHLLEHDYKNDYKNATQLLHQTPCSQRKHFFQVSPPSLKSKTMKDASGNATWDRSKMSNCVFICLIHHYSKQIHRQTNGATAIRPNRLFFNLSQTKRQKGPAGDAAQHGPLKG